MKREWFLAGAMATLAAFLAFEGSMAVWGLHAIDWFIANPGRPLVGPDDIDRAEDLRPFLVLVAIECILFGLLAVVLVVAVLREKSWARRAILVASVCLATMAAAILVLAPHYWETQSVFIIFCVAYWLEWYELRKVTSAL